jgi:hypothetical protein
MYVRFFFRFPWFLKPFQYDGPIQLVAQLDERVIGPAEAWIRKVHQE